MVICRGCELQLDWLAEAQRCGADSGVVTAVCVSGVGWAECVACGTRRPPVPCCGVK